MAAPVGIEARWQAVRGDDLAHCLEAGSGAFFLHEEYRVVLRGGVVEGDDQIPVVVGQPCMAGTILVEHLSMANKFGPGRRHLNRLSPRPHLNPPDPRPRRSEVSRFEAGYSVDWAAKWRIMLAMDVNGQ